jgi:DNA-binding response OmpR family regulator
MKKILVVDDDSGILDVVEHLLEENYEVHKALDLNQARNVIDGKHIDLLILDEMLPDGRGSELCGSLKKAPEKYKFPIIMLTGNSDLTNKLTAFNLGADDYVVKPFEPLELFARVQARLRSAEAGDSGTQNVKRGVLELDLVNQGMVLNLDSGLQKVPVTPIEFKILYLLAKDSGKIHSRGDILEYVWGKDHYVIERTVDQHISKLRKKLNPSDLTIKSLHKQGYVLVGFE